jgi:hypothetical protein
MFFMLTLTRWFSALEPAPKSCDMTLGCLSRQGRAPSLLLKSASISYQEQYVCLYVFRNFERTTCVFEEGTRIVLPTCPHTTTD